MMAGLCARERPGYSLNSTIAVTSLHPRSILVISSPTRPTRGTCDGHPREEVRNKSGDFPVQLATRLPDWSAGGLRRCSAARLSVCRCRFPKSASATRTTCCGHPREDVTRMLRGKLTPWNSSLVSTRRTGSGNVLRL